MMVEMMVLDCEGRRRRLEMDPVREKWHRNGSFPTQKKKRGCHFTIALKWVGRLMNVLPERGGAGGRGAGREA